MTQVTNIHLSTQSANTNWQSENLVQFVENDLHICLKSSNESPLRQIQTAARKIEKLGVKNACLAGDTWNEETQWSFALGFTCVGKLTNVEFTGDNEQIKRLKEKLDVFAWSRDLTNQTPSELYPLKLAELAMDYITAQAPDHVTSQIISGDELKQQGWVGIYNVGKGSVNPPCLLEVDFNPTGNVDAEVSACLVGKGITFDSGGYSLKSSVGMFDMKCDMGGAAVVAGAMALAIKEGLNKRVKLFLCCAENMVSNDAYKLGDILTYKNGVTVEIANTDAEGRIVLADGLLAASATKAPLIIDAATLTGAAVMATGGDYSALFSLDNKVVEQAKQAAEQMNEPLWHFPLESWHQEKCPSEFANTANSRTKPGGGAGGASNAAGFLSRFVDNEGAGWLHFDLAGAYNGHATGLWGAGGTGLGIATIAQLIK
jgi:PepB aminopeptidase